MIICHGSKEIVEYPEIRKAKYNKDFILAFTVPSIKSRQSAGPPVSGKMDI